jgi:hypothetical protein
MEKMDKKTAFDWLTSGKPLIWEEVREAYNLLQGDIARCLLEDARHQEEQSRYKNAESSGRASLEAIREMVENLRKAREQRDEDEFYGDSDHPSLAEAQQAIDEDPLSIEVRHGWKGVGGEDEGPEEYRILLTTGGPAVRIRGKLDQYCQPEDDIYLEVQDWFIPWRAIDLETEDREVLREYARCFYYGD